eukprot:TCONS_00004492-protein
MSMFHSSKKPGQEKNKNTTKFLDSRRDIHGRLKALRATLELLGDHEIKPFFGSYSTEIYYVFYEEFTNLEFAGKSKGRQLKEELEELLDLFEKVLVFLPDLIRSRWQFNSISLILRKLLHHGNVLTIREQGIKLFMIWLQVMQENIDEFNLAIYASIVPGLANYMARINIPATYRSDKDIKFITSCINGHVNPGSPSLFSVSIEEDGEWCIPEGCTPICPPQQGEKLPAPEELTKKFLDRILDYMMRPMFDIQWNQRNMRGSAFYHVFGHFKRFYVPLVFPLWNLTDHLYKESEDIIKVPLASSSAVSTNTNGYGNNAQLSLTLLQCQTSVIRWLIAFTLQLKSRTFTERQSESGDSGVPRGSISSESAVINNEDLTSPRITMSSDSGVDSSLRQMGNLYQAAEIVRSVLYASPDNVLTVYEIYRQCFLMPLTAVDLMSQVLQVFKEWLFKDEKPLFVLEPKKSVSSLSPTGNLTEWDEMQMIRTPSYKEAVTSSENLFFSNLPVQNSRAGFQANLRLFIAITGQIFFMKQNKDNVHKHADICKKVMKMYRSLVLEKNLDKQTWRQLLTVLLDITQHILASRPPESRKSTLGGQLASYLIQTLFVTWIRASLQVYLAPDLWDHLLLVCSTYTGWQELIKEWNGTMEILTRVMAKTVYRIDLLDPPLQYLTRKGKVKKNFEGRARNTSNQQSFSTGWGGLNTQSSGALGRNTSAGANNSPQHLAVKKSSLPRSASEPGIIQKTGKHHLHTLHSDSCVSSSQSMQVHTTVEELIEHQEEDTDSGLENVDNFNDEHFNDHKKTLAQIADDTPSTNIMSFDSVASENVFLASSLTSKDFRDSILPPLHSIDKDSNDSESTNNSLGGISYKQLKEGGPDENEDSGDADDREMDDGQDSDRSSLNIPVSHSAHSLHSLPGYLSESSQNLLGNDSDESDDNDGIDGNNDVDSEDIEIISTKDLDQTIIQFNQNTEQDVNLKPPVNENDSIDTESIQSSGAFTHSEENLLDLTLKPKASPHVSVSSDPESMRFDLDLGHKIISDVQSIDSHMFTMLDKDKSLTMMNSDEVSEQHEGEGTSLTSDEGIQARVRFQDMSNEETSQEDEDRMNDMTGDSQSLDAFNIETKPRSVIEGGTEVGWTPLSSVILWRRMLGIMGNINHIKDPEIHATVFKHLIDLWQMLASICKNQGVSLDNKSSPDPPGLTPALFFPVSWCFQAMTQEFGGSHKPGRVLAFKLMCMLTTRSHRLKPSTEHIKHFYRFLHEGLKGSDQNVINAIIGECSSFFTLNFPGASCLINDFIHGTKTIISTIYMQYPRKEAVTLLGSLLCFPAAFPSMKIFKLNAMSKQPDDFIRCKDLREKILLPLLKAAKNDPSCRARCIALNGLALFVIEVMQHGQNHNRIPECLSVILASLDFHSQTVSNVALDVLWSLSYYHDQLQTYDKDIPVKIIESMCLIALRLHTTKSSIEEGIPEEKLPEYISRLLLVLLDWVMVTPRDVLLRQRAGNQDELKLTYLSLIMRTFKDCIKTYDSNNKFERRQSLNINQMFTGEPRPIQLKRVHNDLGMDDPQGITDEEDTETDFFMSAKTEQDNKKTILVLTARYCINQVLNYYLHFPTIGGATCPTSKVHETDDAVHKPSDVGSTPNAPDEQTLLKLYEKTTMLDSNNMQFLLLNGIALLTVVELPQEEDFLTRSGTEGQKSVCRMIIRDTTGTHSWEVSNLFKMVQMNDILSQGESTPKRPSFERKHSRNLSVSSARLTRTATADLPKWDSVDSKVDRIDQLLRYVGQSSPECLIYPDQQLNLPAPVPVGLDAGIQSLAVTSVLKQHNEEENYIHEIASDARVTASEIQKPSCFDPSSPFHLSKMLLHQLGYFTWENRKHFELLERNEKLLRQIKNLDKQGSREKHKMAVFYVAPGQEDKHSILSNSKGSTKFEHFVSQLGWEVDLSTHAGFMGGLERNLSTGVSAPYYATHSLELIFHVSTRMPGSEEESLKTKLRHLGNDEVHIVWSEHSRDFRRGIVNTEFGDVLIVIYPMKNDLYRIQIDRHPKIQPFGPLFDGAIINGDMLANLVRCTAVNAGRANRATLSMYYQHYEERARCIGEISRNCARPTTFEDFCSKIFAPNLPPSGHTHKDDDGGLHRTFSAPSQSRSNSLKDSAGVLRFMEMHETQTFRSRTQSALPKNSKPVDHKQVYRTASNTSLQNINEDSNLLLSPDFCDASGSGDNKDSMSAKERRKSLSKRFRKKAASIDVSGFLMDKTIGE